MNTATIVQKPWNYCNVLRDDGMSERGLTRLFDAQFLMT